MENRDVLKIADREFRSRLFVGTGKYDTFERMREALDRSGTEVVTVAVRRVNLDEAGTGKCLLDYVDPKRYLILPNTAGCHTVEEALRTARLAREALGTPWIKLEVIGDARTLFPDNEGTLEAARVLVREGFVVLPYCLDDPVLARKLQDVGCPAVMPLAAPIGSGLGIRNPHNIRLILETVQVPVIVDAGVGTASDAAIAMELGCHGLLVNTGIAGAKDPVRMAEAMRLAVEAGRRAFLAGRIPKKPYASASSPVEGLIE